MFENLGNNLNLIQEIVTNIILLAPLHGNGGIASWTRKFLESFPTEEFNLIPITSVLSSKNMQASIYERIKNGLLELCFIVKQFRKTIVEHDVKILHTTTSGSLGTYRDYIVGKLCNKYNIKAIMHCRYGCIPDLLKANGFMKWALLKAMNCYDQIWVLDRYSFDALLAIPKISAKVRLTPNSIEVNHMDIIAPKEYINLAFIANVLPTKGILELIEAVKMIRYNIQLHIVGPATESMLSSLKNRAADLWGKNIIYHGRLENQQAVLFLKEMDTLILPTYFPGEAFPISILEAMSCGKLIIATPRAAIADMLTAIDGTNCGILVREKSVEDIVNAMEWAILNKQLADQICIKAHEKVWESYRTDVVYELYRTNYRALL